jgi:hypothetical protein
VDVKFQLVEEVFRLRDSIVRASSAETLIGHSTHEPKGHFGNQTLPPFLIGGWSQVLTVSRAWRRLEIHQEVKSLVKPEVVIVSISEGVRPVTIDVSVVVPSTTPIVSITVRGGLVRDYGLIIRANPIAVNRAGVYDKPNGGVYRAVLNKVYVGIEVLY